MNVDALQSLCSRKVWGCSECTQSVHRVFRTPQHRDQPEQRMQVGCDVDEDGHYHYTIVTTVNSGFRPDKVGKDTDAVFSPAVAASVVASRVTAHCGVCSPQRSRLEARSRGGSTCKKMCMQADLDMTGALQHMNKTTRPDLCVVRIHQDLCVVRILPQFPDILFPQTQGGNSVSDLPSLFFLHLTITNAPGTYCHCCSPRC